MSVLLSLVVPASGNLTDKDVANITQRPYIRRCGLDCFLVFPSERCPHDQADPRTQLSV